MVDAHAANGVLVEHPYSAVLLDLGLPGESGLSVLRGMRARCDATPVLILTARGQLSERIVGLDAGADDYLVKPFQFDELWARVRSVIRRSQGSVVPIFTYGEVKVDRSRRAVSKGGVDVVLSAHEYRTLLALIERPGHAPPATACRIWFTGPPASWKATPSRCSSINYAASWAKT